jgi:hypothetical protein
LYFLIRCREGRLFTVEGVRLAGDALNDCRRGVQQTTRGRRGRKNDPLYRARRVGCPTRDSDA